jgi:hypothetical protein
MSIENEITLTKKKISIEEFEQRPCTFLTYGDVNVETNGYYCENCDPENSYLICINCLTTCHKGCPKSTDIKPVIQEFICHCGKAQKHDIETREDIVTNCYIFNFDEKSNDQTVYKCLTCNLVICSICYYECHSYCERSLDNSSLLNTKKSCCDCKDENHALNSFVFKLDNFKKQSGKQHYHMQIINTLFENDSLEDFNDFIKTHTQELLNKTISPLSSDKYYNIIFNIAVYTFDWTYRKAYYFHEKFLKLFDYDTLAKLIMRINISNLDRAAGDDEIETRDIYFIYILFYLHMKKDFNNIKKFSIFDYLGSTLTERFKLRELLHSDITKNLQAKYNIYSNNDDGEYSLRTVTLKIAEILTAKSLESREYCSVKVLILRLIYFSLKKMVFDLPSLIKLMKILEKSYDIIFANYEKDLKRYKPDTERLRYVPAILSYFNKILYLVTITYNDLISNNHLTDKDADPKSKEFIHVYSEHGENFLEMVIKNCKYFSFNFGANNSIFSTKVLIVFNETLKMFTLTDNTYYLNLEKGIKQSLTALNDYKSILDEVLGKTKKKILESFFKTGLNTLVENLGKNVENEINKFFFFDVAGIWERVIKYFSDFNKAYYLLLNSVSGDYTPEDAEHEKFHRKITTYTKDIFIFANHNKFLNMFPVFVNILTFSNMDEILTRLLLFTTTLKSAESDKVVDLVVGFLSLLCLTKQGLSYLLKGKNLTRVISIFNAREARILEFLYLIFKGASIYKLDISYNKIIPEATKTIFQYIIPKEIKTEADKIELVHVIRIFTMTARYFDFEEYKKVKGEVVLYLQKSGYLSSTKFKSCFAIIDNDFNDVHEIKLKMKETYELKNTYEKVKITDQEDEMANTYKKLSSGIMKRRNSELNLISNNEETLHLDLDNKNFEMKLNLNKRVSVAAYKLYRAEDYVLHSDSDNRHNDSDVLDQVIYFSFFKLITNNTFYVFEKEKFRDILGVLVDLNDLNFFQKLLNKQFLTLRQRSSLLRYLLSYYLLDILNDKDVNNEAVYLTSQEYQEYKSRIKKGEEVPRRLKKEFDFMENFAKIIQIYITELDNMIYWAYTDKDNLKEIQKYFGFIVLAIKFISDYFFNEKDLSSHMTIYFYKLAYKFLGRYIMIREILSAIASENKEKVEETILKLFTKRNEENELQEKLKEFSFNYFDTPKVYYFVLEAIEFINSDLKLDNKFRLEKILWDYDKQVSLNFFSVGLLFDGEYENFYENIADIIKQPELDEDQNKIKTLLEVYKTQFFDMKNSCFLNVIGNMSSEDLNNYRALLADYFISYILSRKHVDENFDMSIINIITKLLFFDVRKMQQTFLNCIGENNDFFINYHSKFQKITVISYTTAKNFFMYKRFSKYINMKAKLMIQFLQLLGEGFNKDFHQKILYPIVTERESNKLFYDEELMYDIQRYNFELFTQHKSQEAGMYETRSLFPVIKKRKPGQKRKQKKNRLSQTNVMSNEEDNLEEEERVGYASQNQSNINVMRQTASRVSDSKILANAVSARSGEKRHEIFFYEYVINQLFDASEYVSLNSPVKYELPNDNLIVFISNMINFLIEYNGNCDVDSHNIVLKQFYNELFGMIAGVIFNRGENLSSSRKQLLLYMKISYMKLLISIIHNGSFKEVTGNPIIDLNKAIPLTNLFEEIIYHLNQLIDLFKSPEVDKLNSDTKLSDSDIVKLLRDLYIHDMEFEESYELEFSLIIFRYIKVMSETYQINGIDKYFEDNATFLISTGDKIKNNEISFYSLSGYRAYQFMNQLILKAEIRVDEDTKRYNYFVRPPLTFLLSENTKQKFLTDVDRTSAFTKLGSLIEKSDYFLFEMFYNYNLATQGKVNITLKNFRMDQLEAFNYFFVILHQIFLFVYFNKPPETNTDPHQFTDTQKYTVNSGNFVVAIIQLIYIGLVLIVWGLYFFPLFYQRLIMTNRKVKFIIRTEKEANKTKNVIKFTDNFVEDNRDLLNNLNNEVKFWDKAYLFIRWGLLFNTDLIAFILNFALLISYLCTGNALLIVVPVLLLTNLSALLFDIITTIRMRFKQLILVIVYTYLLVYFFSWFSFLYLVQVFESSDTIETHDVNLY